MLQDPLTLAVSGLLLIGAYVAARGVSDSYRALEGLLTAVVIAAALGALAGPYSFPFLVAQFGGPAMLGAVTGSWPDVLRQWPTRLRADLAHMPGAIPDVVAAVAGLVLGVWAWSALARSLGVVGVLVGALAFVVLLLGVAAAPTEISHFFKSRNDRGAGGVDSEGVQEN